MTLETQTNTDPPEPDESLLTGEGEGEDGGAPPDVDDGGEEGSQSTKDASPEGDGEKTDDSGEGDEGEGATQGKKGAYAKLLAKYDGDEEALAEGVWQQSKSLSDMHKRLQSMEGMLEKLTTVPDPDLNEVIAEDAEVKEAADELQAADKAYKEIQQEQMQIIAEHGKLQKQVEFLRGKLESAPPEDRDDIKDDLREAQSDLKEVLRNWNLSKPEKVRLERELRQAAKNFRSSEDNAKERLQQERQDAKSRSERAEATKQEFTDSVEAEAKKYGIPTDGLLFRTLHQSIKDRIQGFLRSLPKGAPGIPIDEAVAELMEEYAEAMELKSRFQKTGKARNDAAGGKTRSRGTSLSAPEVKGKEGAWSADYARKRAEELMP